MENIVTDYVSPPIPSRNFDWVAYLDGREEEGVYGYGQTEREAVNELLELLEEE